jgi:hypothetical protein
MFVQSEFDLEDLFEAGEEDIDPYPRSKTGETLYPGQQ